MTIIGIYGMSGAGKTTFSNMLEKNIENVKVVHVDHILDKVKKVLNGNLVESYKESNGVVVNCLNKDTLFYKLIKSKLVNNFYERLRANYIQSLLIREIKESEESNVEYLIIESASLKDYISHKYLDFKILMLAPTEIRKGRVIKRDQENKYGLIEEYFSGDDVDDIYSDKYDFVVENISDLLYLEKEAKEVSAIVSNYQVYNRERKI